MIPPRGNHDVSKISPIRATPRGFLWCIGREHDCLKVNPIWRYTSFKQKMFILKVGHSHVHYTLSPCTFISWVWFGDLESPDNSAKGIRSLVISRPAGLDYFWLFSTLRLWFHNMKSWAILLLTLHKILNKSENDGHQWPPTMSSLRINIASSTLKSV